MTGYAQDSLETLEARLREILPPEYQDTYEEVQPVSMGSAGLKFAQDGKVAWDRIWNTFCDLAMAGGPPHKGLLLEPGSPTEIAEHPVEYQQVLEEILRGIQLVTGLTAAPSSRPGWVRVPCAEPGMADWLVRAIVMENISAHSECDAIDLPVGPRYRLHKEIKNVITALAKTSHYWLAHTMPAQSRRIAQLFAEMAAHTPLIQPALTDTGNLQSLRESMGQSLQQQTGLVPSKLQYAGWLGLECPTSHAAIWIMRALVVSNILARREGTTLFVAVNPTDDASGQIVIQSVVRIYGFAASRRVL